MTIGSNIRARRLALGLTARDLCWTIRTQSKVAMREAQIYGYESDRAVPDAARLAAIADGLGCTLDDLWRGEVKT